MSTAAAIKYQRQLAICDLRDWLKEVKRLEQLETDLRRSLGSRDSAR